MGASEILCSAAKVVRCGVCARKCSMKSPRATQFRVFRFCSAHETRIGRTTIASVCRSRFRCEPACYGSIFRRALCPSCALFTRRFSTSQGSPASRRSEAQRAPTLPFDMSMFGGFIVVKSIVKVGSIIPAMLVILLSSSSNASRAVFVSLIYYK